MKIEELEADYEATINEMSAIEDRYGSSDDHSTWPAGQALRHGNLARHLLALDQDIERVRARAEAVERVRSAAGSSANLERSTDPLPAYSGRARSNPWRDMDGDMIARADSLDGLRERSLDALELVAGVPQARRQEIGQMLGSRDDDDPYAIEQSRATAEYVLAAADPAYHRAFRKILRNPTQGFLTWTEQERAAYARTESVRTAMSLTSANGGYLVPFTLDPTIVLSNTGALNPFRELGTIKTTATNTWNGVSSAGVTAAWLGEGVEAADASPTVANIAITTQKAAAWVYGSYEVLGDSDFGTQLPDLLADAKNRLEEAAFATGSGTLQPWGAVTRATTVNSATAATFASADIYAVAAAMPDRWYANASFVANKSIGLKIRQMDTAGGSAFWANLGGATPQELLGRRYRESTTMVSTTTTGSKNLLLGDFSQYYIADRLGMQVLYEPMVKSTANGRPSGQAGWFAFWRVGADTAVANAFRVLIET